MARRTNDLSLYLGERRYGPRAREIGIAPSVFSICSLIAPEPFSFLCALKLHAFGPCIGGEDDALGRRA